MSNKRKHSEITKDLTYIVITNGLYDKNEYEHMKIIFELECKWDTHKDFINKNNSACDFLCPDDKLSVDERNKRAHEYYMSIKEEDNMNKYFLIVKLGDNIVGYRYFWKIFNNLNFMKDNINYDIYYGDISCSFGRLKENYDIVKKYINRDTKKISIGKYAFNAMNEYINKNINTHNSRYIFINHPTKEAKVFHRCNGMLPDNDINTDLKNIKISFTFFTTNLYKYLVNFFLNNYDKDTSYEEYFWYRIFNYNQQGGSKLYLNKYLKYKQKYITLKNQLDYM